MRDEAILRVERHLFVRALGAMRNNSSIATQLANLATDVFFAEGGAIYKRGEPATSVYFLVEGSVDLMAPGVKPWSFSGQSTFGIFDAIMDRPYSRTAIATAPVRALAINADDWKDTMEENFDEARGIVQFICGSLFQLASGLDDDGFEPPSSEPDPSSKGESLNLIERLQVLREVATFSAAPLQALVTVAGLAKEHTYAAGEVVFEHGDPRETFMFIARGQATLARPGGDIHPVLGRSAWLPGYAAFAFDTHAYTATAKTALTTLSISYEEMIDIMEDQYEVLQALMKYITVERERMQNQDPRSGAT